MKITIDVPPIVCSRCSAEAHAQPQVVYPNAPIDPVFAAPMSEILRVRSRIECPAVDDSGQAWQVILTSLPTGWMSIPPKKNILCTECVAAWNENVEAFMIPPPPPVVELPVDAESVDAGVEELPFDEPEPQAQPTVTQSHAPTSLNPLIRSYTSHRKP